MKLSEFKVGDRVIRPGYNDSFTILYLGKDLALVSWDLDGEESVVDYESYDWLHYTPPQEFDLMAPAINKFSADDSFSSVGGVLFKSEIEARKFYDDLFISWPALIDTATGMYKVPRK